VAVGFGSLFPAYTATEGGRCCCRGLPGAPLESKPPLA
jgi:hypothetical protein